MTASLKKGRGYTARELTPSVGVRGAVVENADRGEVASCASIEMASCIAEALNGFMGEPRAQPTLPAAPVEHRSLDSIIDQIGGALFPELNGCDQDGEPWRLARARARKAVMLIMGPMARQLIDRAWGVAYEDESVPERAIQDRIIADVLGPPGLEFAWPAGDVPSVGELGEMAVWLIGDAVATERAWRAAGVDRDKPDEFAFTMERLNRYRKSAGMLRRLGAAALAVKREAFERESLIGRALVEIREIAKTPNDSPRLMARIHELAAAEVERIESGE